MNLNLKKHNVDWWYYYTYFVYKYVKKNKIPYAYNMIINS